MTGREYLQNIRTELEAGRHQHRMGEELASCFRLHKAESHGYW